MAHSAKPRNSKRRAGTNVAGRGGNHDTGRGKLEYGGGNPSSHCAGIQYCKTYELADAVLINVALNPNTQLRTLRTLLNMSAGVRGGVACHPNADIVILEHLTGDENENVRITLAAFAQQRNILVRLSTDESAMVRRTVARSKCIGVNTLARLATDPEDRVRIGVAGNINTPEEELHLLAVDESENVRRAVFTNVNY